MAVSLSEGQKFDVLVVGSGAGALIAANRAHDLGLKTLVIEKEAVFGGTTALSGGGIWVPNNEAIRDKDSPEKALIYLKACTEGRVPEAKLRAYVENCSKAIAYLRDSVGVRLTSYPNYPDYLGHLPGALSGRTMFPETYDSTLLGGELQYLRPTGPLGAPLFGRYNPPLTVSIGMLRQERFAFVGIASAILRYWLDIPQRLKTKRDRNLVGGQTLVAGGRKGLLDRGVPLALETPLLRLVREEQRVVAAVVRHRSKEITIKVRYGVILAAGGFEQSQELREKYLPKPTNRLWSITPEGGNIGGALDAGMAVGAATEFLDLVWWTPTMRITDPGTGAEMSVSLMMERAYPGSLSVNRLGRRFVNEAQSYNDYGHGMLTDNKKTRGATIPAWMIFDSTYRKKYTAGALPPGFMTPDRKLPSEWLDKVYFRANSIGELADKINVDSATLEATVHRFNGFARTGMDEDFHRGESTYDRFFGDKHVKPNPSLAPLRTPPYYAIPVNLGDLGTKGGIKTNEFASALDQQDRPIEGLYAIGNTSGAVTAASYPGAGATIGPAITFGFIAANHLAARANDSR